MRAFLLGTAALIAACGDSVSVSNTSPTGSVGGLVVDASTRAPLAGATVTVLAGGQVFAPVTTGEDGTFRVTGVPFGNVLVLVTPADASAHGGATVAGTLIGEAGDFPVGNEALTLGPIGLVPLGDPFRVRVIDEAGAPVDGYEVAAYTTVEWVDYSGGAGVAVGERVVVATTDADGYAAFAGLPEYFRIPSVNDALILALPPYDDDGDQAWEFAGGLHVFNMLALADPTPDVILDPAYLTSLTIQASTISAFEGGGQPTLIDAFDPVYIKFNLPIDPNGSTAWVWDEDGTALGAPQIDITGDTMRLDFPGLSVGAEYNLAVHAVSSVGDRLVEADFAAPFFTRNPTDAVTVSATRSGGTLRLTFSEPVGTGDPGLNSFGGGNCVIFWNYDLGGAALPIGDYPGELGNSECYNTGTFYAVEPDPTGPVGQSGYTTMWELPIATDAVGSILPTGAQLNLIFSRIVTPSMRLQRADGRAVQDILAFSIP